MYESDRDTYVRIHRRSCHNAPDEINPNSSIPVSPVDETGKITLCRWKIYDYHQHFGQILTDYCSQEGFELRKIKYEFS